MLFFFTLVTSLLPLPLIVTNLKCYYECCNFVSFLTIGELEIAMIQKITVTTIFASTSDTISKLFMLV